MDIPTIQQYEYLTHHLEYLNDKIIEVFLLFIKLATGVVGGVFFLHLQLASTDAKRSSFFILSNILFWVIGVSSAMLILNNHRSWRNIRKTLSIEYPNIPPSARIWWWISEAVMCACIMVACILFNMFNPLGLI